MIKTPLRYPGGKSRSVDLLLQYVPKFSEYREPFIGGGSLFIALKGLYPKKSFGLMIYIRNYIIFIVGVN